MKRDRTGRMLAPMITNSRSVFVALACLLLFGCLNPDLEVEASSLSRACVGAAIGSRTSGSVTNLGSSPTAGEVRVRWMLSADASPSTDDIALAGSGAEVTLGALEPGQTVTLTTPNLVVPGSARLGPQFLMLVAVDLGDTEAGLGFEALPITVDQCPTQGACNASYATEAAYLASPYRSYGARPGGSHGRAAFVSDRSTLAARGHYVGGRELGTPNGPRGLLLKYHADRRFAWGRALSHCAPANLDSLGLFNDGSVAVTSSYYTGTRSESAISAYSPGGALLWTKPVLGSANTCRTCSVTRHAVVAVDPSDDTAVVAASDGYGGPVELVRFDRHGNELARKSFSAAEIQLTNLGGPFDIATYRFASRTRSDVFLGFPAGVVLLDSNFTRRFSRSLDAFTLPGGSGYPEADIEVEICTPNDLYVATTGIEYFSNQDFVRKLDRSGIERWAIRVRTGSSFAAPPYTGPQGLLRSERFALRCTEQDLPALAFIPGDDRGEFPREIRAVELTHAGATHRRYRGTFASSDWFSGASGIAPGAYDFLAQSGNKFRLRARSTIGWTTY